MITYIDKETAVLAVSATCSAILYKSEELEIDIESVFAKYDLTMLFSRVGHAEVHPETFSEEEILTMLDQLTAIYKVVNDAYDAALELELTR